MDKIKNMEQTTPFADAIETATPVDYSQVDILRDANRALKLEIIELKEQLNKIKEILK